MAIIKTHKMLPSAGLELAIPASRPAKDAPVVNLAAGIV
jgi:hypothetical protein